jgi:CO dehydrogenase/acetyl-CoA synthase beta subunit
MSTTFELIDKESIPNLNFPKGDVLEDKEDISERKNHLDRALSLGNLERVKIKIYFEDDTSKKLVETTIWGVTDNRVILKQGVVIPVNRIHKIV